MLPKQPAAGGESGRAGFFLVLQIDKSRKKEY
jgi:hypothetical protein